MGGGLEVVQVDIGGGGVHKFGVVVVGENRDTILCS